MANGVVYVGSADGKVCAIRAHDGSLQWSFTTGAPVGSSPAVADGTVYIGSDDGNIFALNAHWGTVRWSVAMNDEGSPAVANRIVYVGSNDFSLYALDATDGNVLWTADTGGSGTGASTTVISDGMVYLNNGGIGTHAFAAGAGTNAVRQSLQAPALSSLHLDMRLTITVLVHRGIFWSRRGPCFLGARSYPSAITHSAFLDQPRRRRPRPNENCPLRMRWANSMPAIVMAALANDLNPAIDAQRRLIAR